MNLTLLAACAWHTMIDWIVVLTSPLALGCNFAAEQWKRAATTLIRDMEKHQ